MEENKVFMNYYQLSSFNLSREKIKQLKEDNDIEGKNEFSNYCSIF